MSNAKKFLELQDMILLKTSLEKVKLHVDSRKERTVYSWVKDELKEFLRKGSKYGCDIESIYQEIQGESWRSLLEKISVCLEKFNREIEKRYREMSGEPQ